MMVEEANYGELLFEETLIPSYLPGGIGSHRRQLIRTWLMRGFGLLLMLMYGFLLQSQILSNNFGPVIMMCDILIVFGILLVFAYAENVFYISGVLVSRPLQVFDNGLVIPPLYFRQFSKAGGYIAKEDIERIVVKRYKLLGIVVGKRDICYWVNAPVEFIVHLNGGKKRRSGPRPPDAIKQAVDIMHERWNVPVARMGSGNGRRSRKVNGRIVERADMVFE